MEYTLRHWSDSLYGRIGEEGYEKSAPRKTFQGNIEQWIYFPQIWFTSSTSPAIDIDVGQISAGSGTSLNYDKARRGYFHERNVRVILMTLRITIVTSKRGQPASHAHLQLCSSWLIDKVYIKHVKDCKKTNFCNERVPAAEPSESIYYSRGLNNEGKRKWLSVIVAHFANKSTCTDKFCPSRVLASSETFFPVTCNKTQVGCERRWNRDKIRNADTISVYIGCVWTLLTIWSAVTMHIGIFITMCFQSRHHALKE